MQFSRVKILQELLKPPGDLHVLVFGEQVHMAERVDSDERQVRDGLAQVMQRVLEAFAVCGQEVHVLCGRGRMLFINVKTTGLKRDRSVKNKSIAYSIKHFETHNSFFLLHLSTKSLI